jgi:hypothetical protein
MSQFIPVIRVCNGIPFIEVTRKIIGRSAWWLGNLAVALRDFLG